MSKEKEINPPVKNPEVTEAEHREEVNAPEHHEEIEAPEHKEELTEGGTGEPANQDYKEAWMRALADYNNLKKQMADKQQEWVQFGNQKMLQDLLPVLSNFETGLNYIPEDQKKVDWVIGMIQIKKQLDEFMSQTGLVKIKTVGEAFDPQKHEALSTKAEEGAKPDMVLQEVSPGYELHGKVIQAAKVIISQ